MRRQLVDEDRDRKRGQKSSKSRSGYNERRVESYRKEKSKITMQDLSEGLKRRLLPGVKDGMSALDSLEVLNTFNAITITITTRGIGFGVAMIFKCSNLIMFQKQETFMKCIE
nr:unnamed protein product [Callosobruchus analis]